MTELPTVTAELAEIPEADPTAGFCAVLLVTVQLMRVSWPVVLRMPPPVVEAVFPEIVELMMVFVPGELSCKPPPLPVLQLLLLKVLLMTVKVPVAPGS